MGAVALSSLPAPVGHVRHRPCLSVHSPVPTTGGNDAGRLAALGQHHGNKSRHLPDRRRHRHHEHHARVGHRADARRTRTRVTGLRARPSSRHRNRRITVRFPGEGRADHVQRLLPNTDVVLLETYSDFFVTKTKRVDGLVISAEAGSAWTILFPAYSVVLPEPHEKTYAALAIPLDTLEFENFINDWLNMKQTGGVIDSLYSKWILGEEAQQERVRWSLGRDVFGLWE